MGPLKHWQKKDYEKIDWKKMGEEFSRNVFFSSSSASSAIGTMILI